MVLFTEWGGASVDVLFQTETIETFPSSYIMRTLVRVLSYNFSSEWDIQSIQFDSGLISCQSHISFVDMCLWLHFCAQCGSSAGPGLESIVDRNSASSVPRLICWLTRVWHCEWWVVSYVTIDSRCMATNWPVYQRFPCSSITTVSGL